MLKKAFVIGSGQVGYAVAKRFLIHGWTVTLANRSGSVDAQLRSAGAAFTTLDRDNDTELERWLAQGPDLLVDTTAYAERHARQLLSVQDDVGSLCVISSASVYRDAEGRSLDEAATTGFPELPVPISEDQPTVIPGDNTYSTRKVALERTLLEQADIPVTVLRPCAIYGIKSRQPREWWFVKRVLDGRRIVPLVFKGESRFHTTATDNIAELVRVAEQGRFHGVLNIADPHPPSVSDIAREIASVFNHKWEVIRLDEASSQTSVGQQPWSVPRPFLLDMSKASSLGYRPVTTYSDAAKSYCKWLADVGANTDWRTTFPGLDPYLGSNAFDYQSEDVFLSRIDLT